MDRRKTIKTILAGTAAAGIAATTGCKVDPDKVEEKSGIPQQFSTNGQTPEEIEIDEKIFAEGKFFNEHETATLAVLADLIIPADEGGPSAKDTGTVEFIDFMMHDAPQYQDQMRGGLKWLDYQCITKEEAAFKDLPMEKQTALLDKIAYPDEVEEGYEYGAKFFSLVRNFVGTGYFTSQAGVQDLGYDGNYPTVWDGVPQEVLEKHGMSYDERWKGVYLKPEERGQIAAWDADGNLIRSE